MKLTIKERNEIIEKYVPIVKKKARFFCKSRSIKQNIDEYEGQALLILIEMVQNHNPEKGKISTYIHGVLHFRLADYHRRIFSRQFREDGVLKRTWINPEDFLPWNEEEYPKEINPRTEQRVVHKDMLRRVLLKFDNKRKNMFLERYREKMEWKDIGTLHNISLSHACHTVVDVMKGMDKDLVQEIKDLIQEMNNNGNL